MSITMQTEYDILERTNSMRSAEKILFILCNEINEHLTSRGFGHCSAEIWIQPSSNNHVHIYIKDVPNKPKIPYINAKPTLELAIAEAHKVIDSVPDPRVEERLMAKWFEMEQGS